MKNTDDILAQLSWNEMQINRLKLELLTSDVPITIEKLIYGYEQQNVALSFVLEKVGEY